MCDLSTGCEIVPPSLSYIPLLAAVGVSWNCSVEMKKYAFLLPSITAHHVLLDGYALFPFWIRFFKEFQVYFELLNAENWCTFRAMVALFDQASTLGRVEHQLTRYGRTMALTGPRGYGIQPSLSSRFSCGTWRPSSGDGPDGDLSTFASTTSILGPRKSAPISVFVEIILNPENLALERLTPVIFKVRFCVLLQFSEMDQKIRHLCAEGSDRAAPVAEGTRRS